MGKEANCLQLKGGKKKKKKEKKLDLYKWKKKYSKKMVE